MPFMYGEEKVSGNKKSNASKTALPSAEKNRTYAHILRDISVADVMLSQIVCERENPDCGCLHDV